MLLNKELAINGDFSAWTGDNPNSWTIIGEVDSDPEVSEVGTGEGHGGAGTGMCNFYTSDGTIIRISQTLTVVIGRKYRISININTITAGALTITEGNHGMWPSQGITLTGIYFWVFVATHTNPLIRITRRNVEFTDVTFDDVSIREEVPTELSRTGHSFASRQEI